MDELTPNAAESSRGFHALAEAARLRRPHSWLGAIVAALLTVVSVARNATAGDSSYAGIAAASEDGAFVAVYESVSGTLQPASCGLRRAEARELLVHARCATDDPTDMLPFDKWTWERVAPEVRRLRKFDRDGGKALARWGSEPSTYRPFVEIFQGGAWLRARALDPPDADPEAAESVDVTGAFATKSGFVVRLHHARDLEEWDEVWTPTTAEVSNVADRFARARADARDATARMRAHRARREAVFAPPPEGTQPDAWAKRRRHGMAAFLGKWEVASVFGALSADDMKDALWLLAWLDSPKRKYEAVRWFGALRGRDAEGATAVLDALAADADSKTFSDFLRVARDHLQGAPSALLRPEDARGLTKDQLVWMHRELQARAGYHFEDPGVREYFESRDEYHPMSDAKWKRLLTDLTWRKSPDAHLVAHLEASAAQQLELIIRAEAVAK